MPTKRLRSVADAVAAIVAETPMEYLPCRSSRRHAFGHEVEVLLERKRGLQILMLGQDCPCGTKRWKRFRVRVEADLTTLRLIDRLLPTYDYPEGYLRDPGAPAVETEDYLDEYLSRTLTAAGLHLSSTRRRQGLVSA